MFRPAPPRTWPLRFIYALNLSFPWQSYSVLIYPESVSVASAVRLYEIPYFFFVSALIVLAGLCGLSSRDRTRTLGGLLGITGMISYVILIMPICLSWLFPPTLREIGYPFFATYRIDIGVVIWFLSVGFYLALAGSLMLLLPLIRTLLERLRKRL